MATFSKTHPYAYHAFPLTAAREIWTSGALKSKQDLGNSAMLRRTTAAVDSTLGFSSFVHTYLPRQGVAILDLPILGTQLLPGDTPPCPHALLVIPTATLSDHDCTICNWNIAVSRPGVAEVCKGGNWTRGTAPQRIAKVWDAFRASNPEKEAARGFWGTPRVPIISGPDIASNLGLLRRAPRAMPELLLPSPMHLTPGATLLAFSQRDFSSLARLGPPPGGATLRLSNDIPQYEAQPDPIASVRMALEDYFVVKTNVPPAIDFDAKR